MRLYHSLFLFLFLLFSACKSDDGFLGPPKGGDFQNLSELDVEGNLRYYTLYVPESYDVNTATPLLINFHGFGGDANAYMEEVGQDSDLHDVAEEEQFIVVYPQGVIRAKGASEWDPADNGLQNIIDNDVFFTEKLIEAIQSAYNIDLNKVYAAGYSNGGMMSYGLACNMADQIAAVGIMSGIMLVDSCESDEYTSIIHFHGSADDVLPLQGNTDYQSVAAVRDFWLEHNNIPSTNLISTSFNGGDVLRDEYTGGNENTSFVLYTVLNEFNAPGGHVWFRQAIDGQSPSQILWSFLNDHTL